MKMGELKWSELEMKKVNVMMELRCEKEWERRKRMVLMTLKLMIVLLSLKLMALLTLELEALVAEEHLLSSLKALSRLSESESLQESNEESEVTLSSVLAMKASLESCI
ncbi:hypothetical protein Taro_041463 [Colocasia esculenta]|uniref:Uncharacterized protein n=1 Tax=Colocasia esculenta TaxID=4460 RepID=A0A843WPY2_COLES|nr:hypothetical protein [Colocasia esculenta]